MVNHSPLDLAQEFTEYKDKVHNLKASDSHFRRMFEEYHTVNHQLHRIEQEIETVSDPVAETLKKKRLQLKDKLLELLHAA